MLAVVTNPPSSGERPENGRCDVHVTLLDGFSVTVNGRDVTPTGVPAMVLKALAVRGPMHVEALVDLLWPDVEPATGRTRLRSVLARLRRSCGDIVERRGDSLGLAAGTHVDAAAFSERAGRAVVWADEVDAVNLAREAWALYRGELLPFDTYVDWTAGPRERIRRRAVAVLDLLADDAAARGRPLEATAYLERAVELQPYDENRYLVAAELLHQLGRRGRAMSMLERARAVADELGTPPSPTYRQLEHAVRGARPAPE